MGFSSAQDPALIQMMAEMIDCWPGDRHELFRQLLNECDSAEQRSNCYKALSPKVRNFKPLPLESYEAQTALLAGAAVSQGRMKAVGERPKPIEVGGKKVYTTKQRTAKSDAMATVQCHKCGLIERFVENTPVAAMIEARKAGWVRMPGINKEYCAKCAAKENARELVTLRRNKELVVHDKRRVTSGG